MADNQTADGGDDAGIPEVKPPTEWDDVSSPVARICAIKATNFPFAAPISFTLPR
jgi:hypothetical protein